MINKSAYIDADFYSDNFTSRYDRSVSPEKLPGERYPEKVHYYNGSLKGILNSTGTKIFCGYGVCERDFDDTDDPDGENMYTMALFLQDEIRLWKNFQAVVGLRYIYNEFFKNYATPNVVLSYKWGDLNFRGILCFRFPDSYFIPVVCHGCGENDGYGDDS